MFALATWLWAVAWCGTAVAADTTPPQVQVTGDITTTPVSYGWYPVRVQATDASGIARADLWYQGGPRRGEFSTCSPVCPALDHTFDFWTDDGYHLEGENTFKVVVKDGAGNITTKFVPFYLETRDLNLNVSGALFASAGQTVTPGGWDVRASASGGPVVRLELLIDGHVVGREDQSCSNPDCPMDGEFWFNTDDLTSNQHSAAVRAVDVHGHIGERTWTFNAYAQQTVFTLSAPATLEEAVDAVAQAGARWTEFQHVQPKHGGYLLGNERPADALEAYRADVQEENGNGSLPSVWRFAVGGDVPSSDLGALASRVSDRQVDLDRDDEDDANGGELEVGPEYPDDLLVADSVAESEVRDARTGERAAVESDATTADLPGDAFAPVYGLINTYNSFSPSVRPRRIAQWLTFPEEAVGDVDGDGDKDESPFEVSIGRDHGYEHDMKLLDRNLGDSGKHPFCLNEKERFWAQRKGVSWSSSFPGSSNPYFDTPKGDDCNTLDFTVGVEHPLHLSPGVEYEISIRTRSGDKPYSAYYVNAQKTFRYCGGSPKNCSASKGPGTDGQLLVGGEKGRTMECRRWRKGYQSKRTCDYLE